ncbi:MAG: (2Fe-2S)-binding protein [Clostridia bacterium]|jgi:aerobic-type carbon monoxide dehydrogenase small subunit (CoxS/CutS family)|nr:(2Fe-2S)-binding protein [Clostridia bacterium]MBT7121502.1 (2Fe-2S)-binding protein [Clostridia bacterium]
MMKIINFNVNGSDIELAIDERESLADTLRERLDLTSVKKGCEVGECGACTVLIDGKATDTCLYLSVWADGRSIITTEGLQDESGKLHPVQQAFIEKTAVQCGFCIPGIIMTCVEIVGRGESYTREQLKKEIEGHLCRCTGYQNIINAIERAIEIIEEAK